jgi:putative transcriptional regulator
MAKRKLVFHLQKILKDRNIGQREIARRCDCRHATIHNMCHNKIQQPPVDVMEALVNELEIDDINELISVVYVDEEPTESSYLEEENKQKHS